jgi:hypothetical protein
MVGLYVRFQVLTSFVCDTLVNPHSITSTNCYFSLTATIIYRYLSTFVLTAPFLVYIQPATSIHSNNVLQHKTSLWFNADSCKWYSLSGRLSQVEQHVFFELAAQVLPYTVVSLYLSTSVKIGLF